MKRYFELIFGGVVVSLKDESRLRDGDDPVRAGRGGNEGKVVRRWNGA